jgi:hypothetical protein
MDKLIGSLAAVGAFAISIFILVLLHMIFDLELPNNVSLAFSLAMATAGFVMTKRYLKARKGA